VESMHPRRACKKNKGMPQVQKTCSVAKDRNTNTLKITVDPTQARIHGPCAAPSGPLRLSPLRLTLIAMIETGTCSERHTSIKSSNCSTSMFPVSAEEDANSQVGCAPGAEASETCTKSIQNKFRTMLGTSKLPRMSPRNSYKKRCVQACVADSGSEHSKTFPLLSRAGVSGPDTPHTWTTHPLK
jgi:hypothetical protein